MKKRMLMVLLGVMCLAGCTSVSRKESEPETGAIVLEDEVVDHTQTTEEHTSEDASATTETEGTMTAGKVEFVYNDFLAAYEDDLARITFVSPEQPELIEKGDKLELKNAIVSRKYYLDAETVEQAKTGDTIEIQNIPYHINKIEASEYGYSVDLTAEVEDDWEKGICTYDDIYSFEKANGGKNYCVVHCSDDVLEEQIYTGSVYFEKDAVINAFVGEDVRDISLKDYVEQEEYPYISVWSFQIDKDGLISFVQNQIAG